MARELPYRAKAPPVVLQLMQDALAATFFLVQESGPLSFVLKDDAGRQFKIRLGSTHACSCGGGRSEHCLHSLYVLLKIFRVLPSNPVCWQLSFNEGELNWLLHNRLNPVEAPKSHTPQESLLSERIDLKEEHGCAICQEEMRRSHSLVFCRVSCGHNFHARCMKVWADHKVACGHPITCPLCRTDWGRKSLSYIERVARQTQRVKKARSHVSCTVCKAKPIRGPRYHCLTCPDVDLCRACKSSHEHFLICKAQETVPWTGDSRPLQVQGLETREFDAGDYQALLELDQQLPLAEFILSAFAPAGGSVCVLCRAVRPCKFKQLQCGHAAHADCLLEQLRAGQYTCPADKACFLPGLGALVVSKENEPVIKSSELFVGGTALGNSRPARSQQKRPEARTRRTTSRPLPVPDLLVTGVQSAAVRR